MNRHLSKVFQFDRLATNQHKLRRDDLLPQSNCHHQNRQKTDRMV